LSNALFVDLATPSLAVLSGSLVRLHLQIICKQNKKVWKL